MSAARQRRYLAQLNVDPHKRAEYLMKDRQWGKKKEDEKILRTTQHETSLGTVKGHEEMFDEMRCMLPLCHLFTAIVAGPTGCGKSEWVLQLTGHAKEMIEPPPEEICYCYGEFQPIFGRYPEVKFHEGMPDFTKFDGRRSTFLVLDDLMSETNDDVQNLFTKGSHHRNVSVMFLTQNLFYKNRHMRTISLNAHYLLLFKNPRDAGHFSILARQMYPSGFKFAEKAYRDATERPFGYLFVDLKPQQDDRHRLRTNIFPGEMQYVYVRK